MRGILQASIALGLVFVTSTVRAEEKYTIKIKGVGKDAVLRVTVTENGEFEDTSLDKDGKPSNKKSKSGSALTYEETVLEKEEGKKAVKARRAYEKAETTSEGKDGKEKTTTLGVQGKTVLLERGKDGKYQFTYEDGKPVSKKDSGHLSVDFMDDKDDDRDERAFDQGLLPKSAVAEGESWTIDVKSFLKEWVKGEGVPEFDLEKASGSGKLVKVYKKDGKLFGEMKLKLEVPILKNGEAEMKPGSKIVLNETLDVCIDGTALTRKVERQMEMVMLGTVKIDGKEKSIDFTSRGRQVVSEEEVKK